MDIKKVDTTETKAKKEYKFKFSIVMAVYKVEEFIREAIDSLICQTVGFESVQVILVDDGSPDGSGAICDEYAAKYPDNIVVVHKENGGLCSARNEGLKYIEGRYVNFFDPDDILSPNTLESVYSFFTENEDAVDMVAIPLFYFGDKVGPHHLNGKFNRGTRVVNLEKEYKLSHLSAASSFFRHEVAAKQYYDPKLIIAEDAEQILRSLIDNPLLGVVDDCKYFYRRRGNSQVTAGAAKRGWYTDYVNCLCIRTFEYAIERRGYVPKFVQNAIMGDLRWRYTLPGLPPMMNDEEIEEYRATLDKCIAYIDDDVIMMQSSLLLDTKIAILSKKHGDRYIQKTNNNILYGFDYASNWDFSRNSLRLCFADDGGDSVILRMRGVVLKPHRNSIDGAFISIDGERIYADSFEFEENATSIGEAVSYYYLYNLKIPKKLIGEGGITAEFFTVVDGIEIQSHSLDGGYLFPASTKYKSSFGVIDGYIYSMTKDTLTISPASRSEVRRRRGRLMRELWKSNKLGERKAVIARLLAGIYKFFHRKPIWIITDRLNKAGDNGEALFRHLKETKNKSVSYYYAITECADKKRLEPLGNVITHSSKKYKMLFLAADCIISSHADDFVINPFDNYYEPYRDLLKVKKFVFLQHGVTQNDISGWLNRYSKNIRGFITTAYPETESLMTYPYHYPEKAIWQVGFARFDRLYNNEKKYVTLMPTWRKYLATDIDTGTGVWNLKPDFKSSEYFRFYNSLINDSRLLEACERCGYTLCFMPHPNIIPHIEMFDRDPRVTFLTINKEYRDVYAESNLVLTDYSSAAFDFAYMRKPIMYAQFDYDEFFKGDHVVTPGYFNYERDGFGEVTRDLESTVNTLIEYIESDCRLKDKYRERIDKFFVYDDKNNCERIVKKISELTE